MRKLAILLMLFSAALPAARAQNNGVTVELQLDRNQFLPEEDLPLKVRIVNRSGQPLVLGADKQWIIFDVTGERDAVVRRLGEMPVMSPFTLEPGEMVTREFNPTPYFGFQRSGRYRVSAIVKLPQWHQAIACQAVPFTIENGLPLPDLSNLTIGVPPPPGVTNVPPEVRRYSLLKVDSLDELKLYFRLTDAEGRTLRVFPLARMLSFGDPAAQIDRANNLHVLVQTGARTFTYCVLDPNGRLLARQFHQYTQTRPSLRLGEDGGIYVGGGQRLLTWNDIPAPATSPAKSQ